MRIIYHEIPEISTQLGETFEKASIKYLLLHHVRRVSCEIMHVPLQRNEIHKHGITLIRKNRKAPKM